MGLHLKGPFSFYIPGLCRLGIETLEGRLERNPEPSVPKRRLLVRYHGDHASLKFGLDSPTTPTFTKTNKPSTCPAIFLLIHPQLFGFLTMKVKLCKLNSLIPTCCIANMSNDTILTMTCRANCSQSLVSLLYAAHF